MGFAVIIWFPFHLNRKHERRIDRVERSLNISQLPSSIEILETDFDSWFNDVTTVEFLIPRSVRQQILSGRDWKKLPVDRYHPPKEDPVEFWMWQKMNDKAELWIYEEESKLRVLASSVQFYESGLEFSEEDDVSGAKPLPNEESIHADQDTKAPEK